MRSIWVGVAVAALGITASSAAAHELADVPTPITDPDHVPEVLGLSDHPDHIDAGDPIGLFVNFDGAMLQSGCGNNSKQDCSQLWAVFGGEILPFPGDDSVRAAIAQAVRADVVDFGVMVTDTRPPDSENYAMVMVGDSVFGGSEYHGFAGVAPSIDCGDSNPNETSFALANSFSANGMATVIHQEAAHTWGLEHVNDHSDNLYPTSGATLDPKYTDECHKTVSNTMLQPNSGICNQVHTQFCNSGFQNSYKEMAWLFGPPVPDVIAPAVTIVSPEDGTALPHPADFELVVTLSDNLSPQILATRVLLDGELEYEDDYLGGTLEFGITGGIAPGEHTISVEARDESGNLASDAITITLEGGASSGDTSTTTGDGTSEDTGDDSADSGLDESTGTEGESGAESVDSGGCGCHNVPAAAAIGWIIPALVRRRRRV